ncbi:hypothetical protein A6V39_00915 [Candidatus Mycoplasma haematobovis]|uniref:Uncharacterized protein n=1 Tax=Candidatus Mycoplasma haematobovis TaxID=432608 RepID=A0A1A9QDR9_9MOLU|nr:hypothetical protein [Candidatus Mycoplasma haematobovis]OAL10613.1 hypothetical protein A6V39_00915 [Candidatus Mycoplasma haematobovis]
MTKTIKIAATTISVGGVAVGSGFGIHHLTKEETSSTDNSKLEKKSVTPSNSFSISLGASVLNLDGGSDQIQWTSRLEELKNVSSDLPEDLIALKTEKTWKDLQVWCSRNSNNSFEREDAPDFRNFKSFCTWKVGDKTWDKKIDANKEATHEDWGTAHAKLKAKQGVEEANLSEGLKTAKQATATENNHEDRKAMHLWCTSAYKEMWTDDNAKSFLEVKEYCRT